MEFGQKITWQISTNDIRNGCHFFYYAKNTSSFEGLPRSLLATCFAARKHTTCVAAPAIATVLFLYSMSCGAKCFIEPKVPAHVYSSLRSR